MSALLNDHEITERVLSHIANRSTDTGDVLWREPVENYRSKQRFEAETERVLRRSFTAFCPSTALPDVGSFIARDAAGRPIVAVRGKDGVVRAFLNVCRHRGMILPQRLCRRPVRLGQLAMDRGARMMRARQHA